MPIDLKECPFCGSDSAYLFTPNGADYDVAIRCSSCGAMTETLPSRPESSMNHDEVIGLWNRRKQEPRNGTV